MPTNKAVVSLTTGLEDPEKVTVALLVSVGAAEQGRDTMMFLTKEAVRLATGGVATGVACEGCPPLPTLLERYTAAGGRYLVCAAPAIHCPLAREDAHLALNHRGPSCRSCTEESHEDRDRI